MHKGGIFLAIIEKFILFLFVGEAHACANILMLNFVFANF